MPSATPYNHTSLLVAGQSLDLSGLKLMLVNGTTVFDATHTTLAQATNSGADEVSGNGWPVGGISVAATASTVDTNDAIIDLANPSPVSASGGSIAARYAILYDDSATSPLDAVLVYYDFDEVKTADEGATFAINISSDGLIKLTVA